MKYFSLRNISIAIVLFLSFFCCTEDNEDYWKTSEEQEILQFFNVDDACARSGTFLSSLVTFVVDVLREQDNLLDAVRNYRLKYGVPLWEYSVGITVEGGFQLFVPVYKDMRGDEILSIWHFIISSDKINQYTLTRDPENDLLEECWKYDYFTIYALGKKSKSGVTFRPSSSSRADAIYYECQTAYIGAEYEGVYVEWPVDTYCWEVSGGSLPLPSDEEDGFPPEIPVEEGVDDGIGGPGGSSGGTTSGGGSAPLAQKIFRNSNMTDQNWAVIEKMIEKIIDDCLGGNLYNGLKEKLDGKTLAIQFTDNSPSFYFNGETTGIKLSLNYIESNHLLHEMFHAYQAYQETQNSYVNAELNLEIEAHYAQYLYLKKRPEFAGSKWSKQYAMDNRHEEIAMLENFLLPNGLMDLDVTEKDLNTQIDSVVAAFRRYPAYSKDSCKYNVERSGLSIFENLKTLTINCDI